MKKILFISSSRADYGLLREVIIETQKLNKTTYLMVTGSHFSKDFGKTFSEIKKDKVKNLIKKNIIIKKFSDNKICEYISGAIKSTRDTILKIKPEILVILGDRYELLGCAIAAMISRVPIVHIHGGEITSGAYDDAIRHSLTKLSHLHFPIHHQYKKRLIQLGEDPKRIFNFGGLGAHSVKKSILLNKKQLEKILKIKFDKKIILVSFHPVTLEKNRSKYQVRNLIKFLKELNNSTIIITSPNFDNESKIIKREFLSFVKKKTNAYFYNSLGHKTYISLMKISYLVIGNSSSGVLETPSFGIKTINIGNRQMGRISPNNVVNCDYDYYSIKKAFLKIQKKPKNISNPFFKKNTPIKIAKKIVSSKLDLKKKFFDISNLGQLSILGKKND